METINDRIEQLINNRFGGSKTAFAKSVGLIPTILSNYLGKQRRSKPGIDMVAKIIKALDVDAKWLILGEVTDKADPKQVEDRNNSQAAERDINNNSAYRSELALLRETISLLKQRIADKDAIIAEKDKRISDKDDIIAEKNEQIAYKNELLNHYRTNQ